MLIEIRSVLTWGGAGMTESTVVKETFWGEENLGSDCYMGIFTCQHSLSHTFNLCTLSYVLYVKFIYNKIVENRIELLQKKDNLNNYIF